MPFFFYARFLVYMHTYSVEYHFGVYQIPQPALLTLHTYICIAQVDNNNNNNNDNK